MRPTYLEVNLSQLRRNIEAIRKHVTPAKVMPMIKANAYGHGVDGVAPFLEPYVDYFGVAVIEEGIHLRELGITKPIIVEGGTSPQPATPFADQELTVTGSPVELLEWAEDAAPSSAKTIQTHLDIH